MAWRIAYDDTTLAQAVVRLPSGLRARYVRLADLMIACGPNLGMSHTRAIGEGLFALRVKGQEGIARVFSCTVVHSRMVMRPVLIKTSQKTPKQAREVATRR